MVLQPDCSSRLPWSLFPQALELSSGWWMVPQEPGFSAPCAGAVCPGWCSWAAAQGGLLTATKSGKRPDLVFWVLWRFASACQEGKGTI